MSLLDRETVTRRLGALVLQPPPQAYPLVAWCDPLDMAVIREMLSGGANANGVHFGLEALEALGEQSGVVVLEAGEADEACARALPWRAGQVWCVLGAPSSSAIDWVEQEAGQSVLVLTEAMTRDLVARGAGWTRLADLLEAAGRAPGEAHNPIIVLARADQCAALENECVLRLEAAGVSRVRTIPQADNVTRQVLGGIAARQAVVVRADAGWTSQSALEEAVETLAELVRGGVQVVMIAEPRLGHEIEDDPDWSSVRLRAALARVDGDGAPATSRQAEALEWPALRDVLPGAPTVRDSTTVVGRGLIGAFDGEGGFALTTLIQQASANSLTGELVLYRDDRFGTLRFYQGLLVGAKILDGPWRIETLSAPGGDREVRTRLMLDRAARMSLWGAGTQWILRAELGDPIAGDAPRIPYGTVAMNIARWVDEVQEAQRTVGGWSRRWIGLPDPPTVDPSSTMGRFWAVADGRRSLLQMAIDTGTFLPEALAAIGEAQHAGLVAPGDDDPLARLDVAAFYDVIEELLRRGLLDACRDLLQAAEVERPLGLWASRIYGYLVADISPLAAIGMWSGLSTRSGEDARDEMDTQEEVNTMLARRLLEVRQANSNALAIWRAARRELEVQAGGYQWSARLAATVAELALRAQDFPSAEAAVHALRDRYPEGERVGLLAPLLTAGRALGARFEHG